MGILNIGMQKYDNVFSPIGKTNKNENMNEIRAGNRLIQDKIIISSEGRLKAAAFSEPEDKLTDDENETVLITVSKDEEKVEEAEEENGEETESEKVSGCMGINVAKLARMLAAAKTKSQVMAVINLIKSDLQECDAGKDRGWDVDEASYSAAEKLLSEATAQMGSAENREPTPEEEMASSIASLM